jgi:hypothetical protein
MTEILCVSAGNKSQTSSYQFLAHHLIPEMLSGD